MGVVLVDDLRKLDKKRGVVLVQSTDLEIFDGLGLTHFVVFAVPFEVTACVVCPQQKQVAVSVDCLDVEVEPFGDVIDFFFFGVVEVGNGAEGFLEVS